MAALRMVTSSSRGIFPLGRIDDETGCRRFLTRSSTSGRPSRILNTRVTGIRAAANAIAVPLVAMIPKPSCTNSRTTETTAVLIGILHADENVARFRQRRRRSHLRFGVGETEIRDRCPSLRRSISSPGRARYRCPDNAGTGKTGFLYREMFRHDLLGEAELAQGFSRHHFRGQFRQRNADRLAHERRPCARRAG